MNIYNYLGGVDLLLWLQRASYSININRLRLGMVCTVTVARSAEFLTFRVELGIRELGLPSQVLKDRSLHTSFLLLAFLPSYGSDYFLGHVVQLVKGS